jgi:orotidine-5'-phosphate decarboxylase
MTELCLALDCDFETSLKLVSELKGIVDIFKVGPVLSQFGSSVIKALISEKFRIFADFKLHDIPNTVGLAAKNYKEMGVEFLTVHAAGGLEMMKVAVENGPKILAVTDLSSLPFADEKDTINLELALDANVFGIVTSNMNNLRCAKANNKYTVKAGIIIDASRSDDQVRTMTLENACKLEVSCVVIGRPILAAQDPVQTAKNIKHRISVY